VGASVLLLIALHASVWTYYDSFRGRGREKGFGLGRNTSVLPVCAADFLAAHAVRGRAFTDINLSALLVFRLSPQILINMDIRETTYGEALFREYSDALTSLPAMQAYLIRCGIDVVVLVLRYHRLLDALQSTGAWVPVHYDDAAILVPRRSDMTALIAHEAYTVITLWATPTVTKELGP
jgi:hypothetical protein